MSPEHKKTRAASRVSQPQGAPTSDTATARRAVRIFSGGQLPIRDDFGIFDPRCGARLVGRNVGDGFDRRLVSLYATSALVGALALQSAISDGLLASIMADALVQSP